MAPFLFDTNQFLKGIPMQLAIAGAASGCPFITESQLERITRRMRAAARSLLNAMSQRGHKQ